jgi:hypothetical protein
MINEFEFYHGVAFARMLHATHAELSIKPFASTDNAAYVLNGTRGIYIKYSSKRLSPWRFSFQKRHLDQIATMKDVLGNVFVLLVCNDDGIVVLSSDEINRILPEQRGETEWISATRNRRQMYTIKGSNGRLNFKIGKDEFLGKLFDHEKNNAQALHPSVTGDRVH